MILIPITYNKKWNKFPAIYLGQLNNNVNISGIKLAIFDNKIEFKSAAWNNTYQN